MNDPSALAQDPLNEAAMDVRAPPSAAVEVPRVRRLGDVRIEGLAGFVGARAPEPAVVPAEPPESYTRVSVEL